MTDHYFSNKPLSKERQSVYTSHFFDKRFEFISASGMFSVGKLDKGTEVLIKHAHIQQDDTVLDLGCSYGVVGIVLTKHYHVPVTLVDVNKRALKYAKLNCENNGVKCDVIESDGFTKLEGKQFTTILFNPPQHAGKELCIQLIKKSINHITQGGSLQVVARHNKGGASLAKIQEEVFGNIEHIAKKSGYRIYKSIKRQ